MSAENESVDYAPTEGAGSVANVLDIEMVNVTNTSGAKNTRNVQTQHGDYRSVDAENIFLIPRCLWPDEQNQLLPPKPTTSSDQSTEQKEDDEEEQVVWIEPFENEVGVSLTIL